LLCTFDACHYQNEGDDLGANEWMKTSESKSEVIGDEMEIFGAACCLPLFLICAQIPLVNDRFNAKQELEDLL